MSQFVLALLGSLLGSHSLNGLAVRWVLEVTSLGRHHGSVRKNISDIRGGTESIYASRMFEVEKVNVIMVTLKMSLWLSVNLLSLFKCA